MTSSYEDNVTCDESTDKLLNELLDIAEDIKDTIATEYDLATFDWIMKDTSNFTVTFQSLVNCALGHTPEKMKDQMKGFRMLTVFVYASNLYRALEDEELKLTVKTVVCDTAAHLNINWSVFLQVETSQWNVKSSKFWVYLRVITLLFSTLNYMQALTS